MTYTGNQSLGAAAQLIKSTDPVRACEVDSQLQNLEDTLNQSHAQLDKLAERLQRVVRIQSETANKPSVPEPILTSLASQIRECDYRAQSLVSKLNYLLQNIEL